MLLTLIVLLPPSRGVLILLAPSGASRWLGGAFSLAVFLPSLWLYSGLLNGGSFGDVMPPQWAVDLPWINAPIGGFHFQVRYALGADGLSMPMIILNGLLTFLAVVSSWRLEKRVKLYMALLLFLETGVMGVFA